MRHFSRVVLLAGAFTGVCVSCAFGAGPAGSMGQEAAGAAAGVEALAARVRLVVGEWGTSGAAADVNADGVVDAGDLALVLAGVLPGAGPETGIPGAPVIGPSWDQKTVWVSTVDEAVAVYGSQAPWGLRETLHAPGPLTIVRPRKDAVALFDVQTARLHVRNARTFELKVSTQLPTAPYVDAAWVTKDTLVFTRSDDSALWRLTLPAGRLTRWTDLAPVAGAGMTADNRAMIVVDGLLYAQVQPVSAGVGPGAGAAQIPHVRAVLAIVDLATGALVDADPGAPGAQGILLAGTLPTSDMAVSADDSWLLVSSPGELNTNVGGIEKIDLRQRRSKGLVVSENGVNSYAQLGGFAFTDEGDGVFVFHTDLAASSHLQWFNVETGAPPHHPVYDSLGGSSDAFAWARGEKLVYFADVGEHYGLLVINPGDQTFPTPAPITTPGVPFDVAVVE